MKEGLAEAGQTVTSSSSSSSSCRTTSCRVIPSVTKPFLRTSVRSSRLIATVVIDAVRVTRSEWVL